jgi:NAD(P) transhydrogenase subunit alpha
MIVGVPRETYPGERRVALVPAVIPTLAKAGIEVVVEAGAGKEAGYLDTEYAAKGAKILPTRADVFAAADIVVQVLCYGSNDKTGKADVPL